MFSVGITQLEQTLRVRRPSTDGKSFCRARLQILIASSAGGSLIQMLHDRLEHHRFGLFGLK
jgi:hypothetical protein